MVQIKKKQQSAPTAPSEVVPATPKPDVRLAVTVAYGAMSPDQVARALGPDVRLALQSNQGGASDGNAKGFCKPAEAPNIRLAHSPGAQGDNVLVGQRGVAHMPDDRLPALLVSYYYLPQFLENRHRYHYRDWVMDSGAFSAHNSGVEIKLQDYIDCCKKLIQEDPTLVEVYALDVIGDWKASLKNTEEMWRQGVPAIPCFHVNEPWDALIGMAKDYPKIAFGGVAQIGSKKAIAWAEQCFARIWPKKVHGFAMCNESALMKLPLHSVDSTSWEIGPCLAGNTLISTPTGLREIHELVAHGKGLVVNTHAGVSVARCQAVYSGNKPLLKITLASGQTIRCTENHKILTDSGWVEAGKLSVGDGVRVLDRQVRTPVIKESLLDEMLGWMVGGGWFTQEHSIGILFSEDDAEAMQKLLPIWDQFVCCDYALTRQDKVYKKVCERREIIEKFKALGFKTARAPEKELPTYILTEKPESQLAFLRGLFSADGSVKLKGTKACQIVLASNSRVLLHQVQLLLMEYGIQSHQHWTHPPGKENEQGQLTISGIYAFKYVRLVGFNLIAKQHKFRLANWTHARKAHSLVKSIECDNIEPVYDILMPSQHHFIANGVVVHNCKYGQWKAFGNQRVSVRGSKQNLRIEVEHYLDLEQRARVKWKKQMAELESKFPTVRLALAGAGSNTYLKDGGAVHQALAPDVRLVAANDAGRRGADVISTGLCGPTIRLAEGGEGGRIEAKVEAFKPKDVK